ncbi:hypothetical protein F4813DRAFT_399845 [Daldinia decipiens]|uniref:uncharacterized protein n=1 Tax=Daldinia decipiens TaxID=326647 RepID=UPI0020C4E5AE|nr:uncharacterized protein F4813DRAFT_399845 [Daldinia decipiens]KAI1653466.1 hypothetical protein F4813DRAFT_399845 [Daldinia decipiens]
MIIPTRRQDPTLTVPVPTPGCSYNAFLSILWTGAGLSLISVFLRLISRFRGPRRLYWNDAFVILGEILFMYYVLDVSNGIAPPGPQLLIAMRHFLDVQHIADVLFYTTLVLVKLSLLFFFRRLGHNVQGQKYIWWPFFIFSLLVYIISLGDTKFTCFGDLEFAAGWCSSKDGSAYQLNVVKANMALDVFSDFLIILIPFTMLWNVRIPRKKKLAFIALFSLSAVTITIAIIRAVASNSPLDGGHRMLESTTLWMWSAIQGSLAIIVACLSAFPQLFTGSTPKKPVWTPTETYYHRLRERMKTKRENTEASYCFSTVSVQTTSRVEPAISYPGNSFMRPVDNRVLSSDSQLPWLTPKDEQHNVAVSCSRELSGQETVVLHPNQIQHHVGYRVTWE